MIRNQRWSSLMPVEFTIAGVALAILASAAAPTQVPNQIAANEAAAIEALRTIAAAQETFRAAADIDTNCDGADEYGYFAELAGRAPLRYGYGPPPCTPNAGSNNYLNPPLLRTRLGNVMFRCVVHHGYVFQMWLPTYTAAGEVMAIAEDFGGGKAAAPFPDPVNGAHLWCCYAWPVAYNQTGKRAFFVNQRGQVLEDSNRNFGYHFEGFTHMPTFDQAYSVVNDMGSPPRIGMPNAMGSVWWPVP